MRTLLKIASVAVLALLATVGCESRTDKTDGGGVLLSLQIDSRPIVEQIVSGQILASLPEVTIQNIVKDPTGSSSQLMNVELESYEVTYQRQDTGTRTPATLVEYRAGVVPVNGSFVIAPVPYLRADQLNNPPLSDLTRFGYDTETGSVIIRLRVGLRFFGRTLAGKKVETAPAYFTVDVMRG